MALIADQKKRVTKSAAGTGVVWITVDGKPLGNPIREEISDDIIVWLVGALAELEEQYAKGERVTEAREDEQRTS